MSVSLEKVDSAPDPKRNAPKRKMKKITQALNVSSGPMVLVLGLVMGLIYWDQVKSDAELIDQNKQNIVCQDRWNAAFEKTIAIRFDIATRRKDLMTELLLAVGDVIAAQPAQSGPGSQAAVDAKYRPLFADFAKKTDELVELRKKNPIPDYPDCFEQTRRLNAKMGYNQDLLQHLDEAPEKDKNWALQVLDSLEGRSGS